MAGVNDYFEENNQDSLNGEIMSEKIHEFNTENNIPETDNRKIYTDETDTMKPDTAETDIPYTEEEPVRVKLKVPILVILFLVAIISLSIVSMIKFPGVLKDYKVYKNAESRMHNGETSKVLEDLYALVEKYPDSVPIIIRAMEHSMENGYYDYAGYIYNNYLVGKNVNDEEYALAQRYMKRLDKYYDTIDKVTAIYNEVFGDENKEIDENDYLEITTKLSDLLHNYKNLDNAIVYYYLAMFEGDIYKAIEYIENCYKYDPECFDVRAKMALYYRRAGDLEKAWKYTNEALAKDKTDSEALRSQAILYMLEGKMEEGLEAAEKAYNYYSDGVYIRDTYMIALHFNGKTSDVEKIKNEIIDIYGRLEEDTISLLEGKITLKDYYIEGEAQE